MTQTSVAPAPLPSWRPLPYDVEARRPWKDLPFSDEEYRSRLEAVRRVLRERDLKAMLVCGNGGDFANVRYLSGFPNHYKGDLVIVVPETGEPIFITNAIVHGEPMHIEIYQNALADVRCAPSDRGRTQYADAPSMTSLLEDVLADLGLKTARVGTTGFASTVSGVLKNHARMHLEDCSDILLEIRAVKSPAELMLMRRAGAIGDAALRAALAAIVPGNSERDVAAAVAGTMMGEGADESLYIIQAVSGPRSGFRNVGASDRTLAAGDPIYVGFGLRHRGYCNRIGTGTTVGAPSEALEVILEANAEITEACIELVRPGLPVTAIVQQADEMARRLGVADETITGGHGVGVHTHDKPYIQHGSTEVFEEGMVFVFEPVIYKTGVATANAERLYEVTATGCAPLSSVPLRVWDYDTF